MAKIKFRQGKKHIFDKNCQKEKKVIQKKVRKRTTQTRIETLQGATVEWRVREGEISPLSLEMFAALCGQISPQLNYLST